MAAAPGGIRQGLRTQLQAGEVLDLAQMAARTGHSEKQLRDAVNGLRKEGLVITSIGKQRYVLDGAPESPPAGPPAQTPQKRRAVPSPPVPKQRRRSAAERAQAAPPLGARLQVVGLGLDKARVLVTLTDGTQEWTMTFDTAPPPAWAEEGGE